VIAKSKGWKPGQAIHSDADFAAAVAVMHSKPASGSQRPDYKSKRKPLPGHPGVFVEVRETQPDEYTGEGWNEPRMVFDTVVVEDGHKPVEREALRARRQQGHKVGWLVGDIVEVPDSTRRGVPADYDGDNPLLCNAKTRTGKPCRAVALPNGRCKWHGGMCTGPKTPEGKAKCMANLPWAKKRQSA